MATNATTPAFGGVNAAHQPESNQDISRGKSLKALRINGASPFYSHADGVSERLNEAHALLTVLSSTYGDADDYHNHPNVEISLTTMNYTIVQRAFEGVATLIALAQHHYDHVSKVDQGARS